jgi:hypothetical protein
MLWPPPRRRGCGKLTRRANFPLSRRANHSYNFARLTRQEGRIAIVTNAGWDAVDAAASGAQRSAGRVYPVSDQPARRRTATVLPSLKLRRTGSKEPGEAFGVDGRCVRQNRVVLASVADVKLSVATSIQPDRLAFKAGSDGDKNEFVAEESTA